VAEIPCDYVIQVRRTDFGDYKGLYWHEKLAINSYMFANDELPIHSIMTKNKEISPDMMRFCADKGIGKIRCTASKREKTHYDKMECYRVINALMAGKTLDEALDSFARSCGKPESTIPQRVITKKFDIIAKRENLSREAISTRYYYAEKAIRKNQEEQLRAFVKETLPEKHWIK
jgi:hypothetical protein